jgi:hypothetical protein
MDYRPNKRPAAGRADSHIAFGELARLEPALDDLYRSISGLGSNFIPETLVEIRARSKHPDEMAGETQSQYWSSELEILAQQIVASQVKPRVTRLVGLNSILPMRMSVFTAI